MLYKKIDASSVSTITSALNFFETPPTNVSIANSAYREYLTLNPINSPPFHFKIHPITSYIDLSKCYILTEMRIRKVADDGTRSDMAEGTNVAPIQMIGGTFIRNMKVVVNGQETFDSNALYPYKVYLDYELSYPASVKDSFLTCAGYGRDKAGQTAHGSGFEKRRDYFDKSRIVQFMHKIDADLFNQDLYLVNNVEIDIEITPNEHNNFLLIQPTTATDKFALEIISCKLYVKTIDLMDGYVLNYSL